MTRKGKQQNWKFTGIISHFVVNLFIFQNFSQRDNSGKYIKFRFVDQLSKITMYSCIAPLPKPPQKLELYFNNDQSTPFTFDSTGYLMAKEEQFQMDAFSGKPNQQVVDKRLYDYKEFQAWIAPVINDMLEEEEPVSDGH